MQKNMKKRKKDKHTKKNTAPIVIVVTAHRCSLWPLSFADVVVESVECLVVVADVEIRSDSCAVFAEFDGSDRTFPSHQIQQMLH